MEFCSTTTADLADVFRHLDQRMADEYTTAGFNVRQIKDVFRDAARHGRSHTLLSARQKIAVVMWEETDGAIATSFAAKPAYFDRRHVLPSRRHIREIQRANGNLPVHSYSYSTHPHVGRWFEALRFERYGIYEKATIYRLPPTSG